MLTSVNVREGSVLRLDVVIRFMLFAYTDTLVLWDVATKGR